LESLEEIFCVVVSVSQSDDEEEIILLFSFVVQISADDVSVFSVGLVIDVVFSPTVYYREFCYFFCLAVNLELDVVVRKVSILECSELREYQFFVSLLFDVFMEVLVDCEHVTVCCHRVAVYKFFSRNAFFLWNPRSRNYKFVLKVLFEVLQKLR